MELEFTGEQVRTVTAGEIKRGQLLKLPDGKTAYMRIHNPHKDAESYQNEISVVNLATGYSYEFPRTKVVIPLCGTATVSLVDC